MTKTRTDMNARQALLALGLYVLSFAAFLWFWVDVMFGSLTDGVFLVTAMSLWLLSGVLAIRTQFFYIDRKAWENVALCRWEKRNREALATAFILWNIANVVVLAIDATLRKTGATSAFYPWFMLVSISVGYGWLLWRCAALGIPALSKAQGTKE
ncbi:MAG: hypothetical protein V2I76_03945 [Roseobacter sp.]|jgi:hypothetical protein|nr:hypothetical protein [Roseobacter sp.]